MRRRAVDSTSAILAENGIRMSEDEAHARFVGKTFAAMIEEMEREHGVRFPADASAQKDRRLLDLYERELKPVAGISEALAALCRSGSASPRTVRRSASPPRCGWRGSGLLRPHHHLRACRQRQTGARRLHRIRAARRISGRRTAWSSRTASPASPRLPAPAAPCWASPEPIPHPQAHAARLATAGAQKTFTDMRDLPALAKTFL